MENRAVVVMYVRNVTVVQAFYREILGFAVEHAESDHVLLGSPALQLTLLQIPASLGATITIADPPRRRSETPIKLVFQVASLATTRQLAPRFGGELYAGETEWSYRGHRVCDGQDPEGNVLQCREKAP